MIISDRELRLLCVALENGTPCLTPHLWEPILALLSAARLTGPGHSYRRCSQGEASSLWQRGLLLAGCHPARLMRNGSVAFGRGSGARHGSCRQKSLGARHRKSIGVAFRFNATEEMLITHGRKGELSLVMRSSLRLNGKQNDTDMIFPAGQ